MTQSNYTRNILNIKDVNVNFYENCLDNRIIKGVKTKVFRAYLTYNVILVLFVNIKILLLNGIGKEIVKLKCLKFLITMLLFY